MPVPKSDPNTPSGAPASAAKPPNAPQSQTQEPKAQNPSQPSSVPPPPSGGLLLNWFLSGTVREAVQLRRHVGKIVRAQCDLLKPEELTAVRQAMAALDDTCRAGDKAAIHAGMAELEKVATKSLRSHHLPSIRENIEVLLVAIAIAMAIRTFFLQPFKIPTGSMQPTLWGITSNPEFMHDGSLHDDLQPKPDFTIPNVASRFLEFWIHGVSYTHEVARSEGAIRAVQDKPDRFLIFDFRQRFWLGDDPKPYTVWFPPDSMFRRAGLVSAYGVLNSKVFKKGEDVIKMRTVSGDHLFVDRLTYNFRPPKRGEITVFETRHIRHWQVPTDQFYIKRLVGLGDEKISINTNRHLVVNGKELTASTPRFENLYSYHPEWKQNEYFGHEPFEKFADGQEFQVPQNHYLVMGDNTRNSLDSRYWGAFPQQDLIGKAWFVYWPITSRFGWGYR